MKVYHGSVEEIHCPNIKYSKRNLDFGRGFYLTSYKEQADKWAKRKAVRQKSKPIVNEYELDIDKCNLKVLKFETINKEWLDFVCACRRGEEIYKEYDIIIGNVADDDVFKTVDMYFKGIWEEDRAMRELKYYKKNDQICIVNQEVINTYLKFLKSYEVRN